MLDRLQGYWEQGLEIALAWLLSPAAWVQFALIIAAYFVAVIASRFVGRFLTRILTPPEGSDNILTKARLFVLLFIPLLLPIMAYIFLGIGESVTRATLGSGEVIGFGKRAFLLLGAYTLVHKIITDSFLKLLGKYVLLPRLTPV